MLRVYHGPDIFVLGIAHLQEAELCAAVSEAIANYHCVAEVDTDDADAAFRLTNSLDRTWWTNPGVRFFGSAEHGERGARSTSIGDVIERENGDLLVAAIFGFVPLPRPEGFKGRPRS